jgi:Rha family phage regulatory protein
MKLVEYKKGEVLTTSLKFADEFKITHMEILRKIRNLTMEYPIVKKQFKEDVFTNDRNRQYPFYYITRDGYMTLVMNTSAKGESVKLLFEKKQLFIKAFNKMEELLLTEKTNKQNLDWNKSREQGKEVRIQLTDTIRIFVNYATGQGSKNSKMYYANITKMEYKALGLMQENVPSLRNTLDAMQLYQLILAEDLVTKQIERYMIRDLHYKEIYLLVKQDLLRFADSLMIEVK